MENNRVIAEVENMVNDLESALVKSKEILGKIKGYSSFSNINKSADCILYLNETEALNESLDKKLVDTLIRCKAISDIFENEINQMTK